MLIHSEMEMLKFGQEVGEKIKTPAVIELLGDVGAGKTTFTRGLAKGLGVNEELSSPSFTISREYRGGKARLIHYDFYRLADPGIMSEDLAEALNDSNAITVVEWGESIRGILPKKRIRVEIKYVDENTREVNEVEL